MFADLLIPDIQAHLATIAGLLVQKGVCTAEEYETRVAETKKILNDPNIMRDITNEWIKRHPQET